MFESTLSIPSVSVTMGSAIASIDGTFLVLDFLVSGRPRASKGVCGAGGNKNKKHGLVCGSQSVGGEAIDRGGI